MTDSPETFTVCKGGRISPFLFIQISSFNNKKCPEKLWITVDTRILAVYFIQTSIARDTAGLQFPPHRSVSSRLV